MNLIILACRNVGRNRYRTAITIFAIGFAGAVMLFYSTLMVGLRSTMENNLVGMNIGKIQIHANRYRENPDIYTRISEVPQLLDRLEANGFHAAPRLYDVGLAAFGDQSSGVMLRGIDLVREPNITRLHHHLQSGFWLDAADPSGVVIGAKLSRALSVAVGGEIVLISQAADGSMANDLYRVRGILKATSEEIDRLGVFMDQQRFRAFLSLEEGAHEIAVIPKEDTIDLDQATKTVAALLPPSGLEVKNWRELQPAIARVLRMNQVAFFIILLLAYVAVALTALNAMLMSVFERIPEIGMMKAVGVTPGQIIQLTFIEAMMKTIAALVFTVGIGAPLTLYFQQHGIDLSGFMMKGMTISGVAFEPIIYPKITLSALFTPLFVLVAVVILAVIYPSVKGAIIQPVEAMHHN